MFAARGVHGALAALAALAALVGRGAPAGAGPAADLVIAWAPDHDAAPLGAAARAAGAAFLDRSPPRTAGPEASIDAAIRRGIDRFEALQLDAAWAIFEEVRGAIDRTGAAGASPARLSDLFVYRGAIRAQRDDADGAWEESSTAMAIAPARVLDPARFAPRTIEQLERARAAALARPRAQLAIDAPADCAITLDGAPAAAHEVALLAGPHWIGATCPGAAPWGARAEVAAAEGSGPARVRVAPAPLAPPPDSDALIQARAAGAAGVVIAQVRGRVAVLRRLGLDGRERDRRAVTIGPPGAAALEPAAGALRSLLRPPAREPWYRSRWAWAAGAAGIAAAIAIPIAVAAARDAPGGASIGGPGALP